MPPEDNKRKLGNFSSSILILEKKMSFLEKVCKDAEKAGCQLVQEEHEINERLASLPPLKASVNQQLVIMNKELSDAQEERKQFDLNSPYWIISGVKYCHNNMVAHRDLRPENIFLDSNYNIKIAGFSLSKTMKHGQLLKTSCGSTHYAAPEVISGKLYAGSKVDVWSCGVLLYALLCGRLPFDDENIPKLYINIKGGVYTIPSYLSHGASDLISRLLEVDPMKRITILEIHQHPWFKISLPNYLALPPPPPPPEKVQQPKKEELWLDNPGCKNVLFYLLLRLSWLLPQKLVNIFFRCLDEDF
ncbi:SNF1-related protein kinase catalytic subunit alpha KIN10 [Trifolium repens]|nr:SNF1-related protein kinase catalytic subunit alpha KIN10 [Trifolium repens]